MGLGCGTMDTRISRCPWLVSDDCGDAFGPVATPVSKRQVVQLVGTTEGPWLDVLNLPRVVAVSTLAADVAGATVAHNDGGDGCCPVH